MAARSMVRTLLVAAAFIGGTACDREYGTEGTSAPERAVERLLNAVAKSDQDEFLNVLAPELRSNPFNALAFLNISVGLGPVGTSFGMGNSSFSRMSYQTVSTQGDEATVRVNGEYRILGVANPVSEDIKVRRLNGRWYVAE